MNILVIEDNPDFAQLLCDLLEIKGCGAIMAHNASSGMRLAKERRPSMIFCDLGLPGEMDGLDFAAALRKDVEIAHIPLIAVTGYSSDEDKKLALDAGFDMVFPKPVKFADLTAAIDHFRSPVTVNTA
jgi:CheY-like chemotaxis protein